MITKLSILNFKSISKADITVSNLNLFTGLNASGKSTVLQSLLLLRQSFQNGYFSRTKKGIFLGNTDSFINLGTYRDVFSQNAPANESLFISINTKEREFSFKCQAYNSGDKDAPVIPGSLTTNIPDLEALSLFSNRFQFLAADRISPQVDYPRFESDEQLGKDGRFTPHFLEKNANKPIALKKLMHEKSEEDDDTLIAQVNYWMRDISPNIQIQTKENLNTNKIELSYRYLTDSGVPTQDRKPQNVGYGITPTLPILVALLSAKSGDLIIIENPETHVHPKGQSRIAMLLARAANEGVQILIESHSDHILNGIRVATKKGLIDASNVCINFFTRSSDEISSIQKLNLDSQGRIDLWPKGFFDEWDNMLDELI